jgi:hypothetical protein
MNPIDYSALAQFLMGQNALVQPVADPIWNKKQGVLGGLGTEGARSRSAGGGSRAPSAAPPLPGTFAQRVQAIAKILPDTPMAGGQGAFEGKVAIKQIYDRYGRHFSDAGDLNSFKARLIDASKKREVDLSRADSPQYLDKTLYNDSAAKWGTDSVHFVRKK